MFKMDEKKYVFGWQDAFLIVSIDYLSPRYHAPRGNAARTLRVQ